MSGSAAFVHLGGCAPAADTPGATVVDRTKRGSRCRYCAARSRAERLHIPGKGASLVDVSPNVAAEWHPTRNDQLRPEDLKPYSNRKVWWRCREGHEWRSTVGDRAQGRRCPHCLLHATSAQQ